MNNVVLAVAARAPKFPPVQRPGSAIYGIISQLVQPLHWLGKYFGNAFPGSNNSPIANDCPGKLRQTSIVLGLVALLAGCVPGPSTTTPAEDDSDQILEQEVSSSERAREYYAGIQEQLLDMGHMRIDEGGQVTYSAEDLARNFERIAFYNEFSLKGRKFVHGEKQSRLRRWEIPIRISLVFGDSIPADQRNHDRKSVASYAKRLADITGLDISISDRDPNFFLFFLNAEEQARFGNSLHELNPKLGDVPRPIADAIQSSPINTFCVAFSQFRRTRPGSYYKAIILIKNEHPELMKTSCIHEEVAQALGLTNDSPDARPSIFNDDEEFALLTEHDEKLLAMLYDPRLTVGMTRSEAQPIVKQIAREIHSEGSSNKF